MAAAVPIPVRKVRIAEEIVTELKAANIVFLAHNAGPLQIKLAIAKLNTELPEKKVYKVSCVNNEFMGKKDTEIISVIMEKLGRKEDESYRNIMYLCIENNVGRTGEEIALSAEVISCLMKIFPVAELIFHVQGTNFTKPEYLNSEVFKGRKITWHDRPRPVRPSGVPEIDGAGKSTGVSILSDGSTRTTTGESNIAPPLGWRDYGNALLFGVTCGCIGKALPNHA